MIRDLWLIGMGTGSPAHITLEGMAALRAAATILLPHKGADKDDLAGLRQAILEAAGTRARVVPFTYPQRDPDLPYQQRVEAWHDEIALQWQAALKPQEHDGVGEATERDGPGALLVWGDPALYDSTLRIARRLTPAPQIRVIPGITAIQALTAAHAIPLNTVDGPVTVTTGRRLRAHGWPEDADTVVVMLDGACSFADLSEPGLHIWWGAFLGMPEQVLVSGPLPEVANQIKATRAEARARHGWLMDTYLLRRS